MKERTAGAENPALAAGKYFRLRILAARGMLMPVSAPAALIARGCAVVPGDPPFVIVVRMPVSVVRMLMEYGAEAFGAKSRRRDKIIGTLRRNAECFRRLDAHSERAQNENSGERCSPKTYEYASHPLHRPYNPQEAAHTPAQIKGR